MPRMDVFLSWKTGLWIDEYSCHRNRCDHRSKQNQTLKSSQPAGVLPRAFQLESAVKIAQACVFVECYCLGTKFHRFQTRLTGFLTTRETPTAAFLGTENGIQKSLATGNAMPSESLPSQETVQVDLARVRQQQAYLAKIAVSDLVMSGDFRQLACTITENASTIVDVDRASVWLFRRGGQELYCLDLFEVSTGAHTNGLVLKEHHFRNEFAALQSSRYIDASDALTDPRTAGYVEEYLKPLGISALLDAVILHVGEACGVLCLEHIGAKRVWTPDEIAFACQLADQLALTHNYGFEKRVKATLAASESKYRELIEGIEDIVCTVDLQGIVTYIGPQVSRYGFDPEEITGKPFAEFIHPDDRPGLFEAFKTVLTNQTEFRAEFRVTSPWVGTVWFEDSPRIRRSKDGSPNGLSVILRDVTERHAMEDRLHTAKEAAESASRAKSEFLANMSHEIRTPMTAILGYSELLFEEDMTAGMSPERATAWESIRRNGDHLLSLINSLLELSQIESGELQLEPENCRPLDLVLDVITSLKAKAFEKNLILKLETGGRIPDAIQVDPVRLRQILFNLIGNAIKFTDRGEIRVVVSQIDRSERQQLQFDVIDTGIGIPKEQVARLFGRFVQVESGANRRFGGTGLGLAISQRLAVLLGGGIEVDSRAGEGSCFRVTINALPPAPEPIAPSHDEECGMTVASETLPARALDGAQILLAEDGLDNQRLISVILSRAGANVTIAENGQVAVERVLAWQVRTDLTTSFSWTCKCRCWTATRQLANCDNSGTAARSLR